MDNTYISKFINSKDIRKYLQDINYQFSVPEAAFLIWQNKETTIAHRHEAFMNLIKTTDSCMIKTSCCREGWDLHQTISKYVALEDRIIQLFFKQEPNCFYVGEWTAKCDDDWHGGRSLFTDCVAAYAYAFKYAEKRTAGPSFHLRKNYIDNSESASFRIDAFYNSNGEMVSIDFTGKNPWSEHENTLLYERFDDMWFDIPIPFKPGDIVCDRYHKKPFVITTTTPCYRKEHPPKRDTGTINLTNMDMTASGYSVDEETLSVRFNWCDYPYLNLEYYTGELSRENRILLAYSLFKHDKINGDTLSKLTQLITTEQLAKRIYHDIDWMLEGDVAKQLGLDKYKEKKHE